MVAIKHELDTVQQVKEEIEELREYVDRLEEHTHRRKLRLLEQVCSLNYLPCCVIKYLNFISIHVQTKHPKYNTNTHTHIHPLAHTQSHTDTHTGKHKHTHAHNREQYDTRKLRSPLEELPGIEGTQLSATQHTQTALKFTQS